MIQARAQAHWRTGVEMEALVAVSAAGLTIYDMCKAIDRGMTLGEVQLVSKSGGKSGEWTRSRGRNLARLTGARRTERGEPVSHSDDGLGECRHA